VYTTLYTISLDGPSLSINAGRADDEFGSPGARRGRPREQTSKERGVPMSAVNLDDTRVGSPRPAERHPRTTNCRPDRRDQAAAFPAHGLPVVRVKLAWLGEIATTDELVAALAPDSDRY
jgi:hypothetical protein